jgi:NitT/TauT family transport system substrate-binding protein
MSRLTKKFTPALKARAVFILSVLFFSLSLSHSYGLEKVREGYSGIGSGVEILIFAKETGLFKKHGLDLEPVYIPGGTTVLQSMMAGELQFGNSSVAEVLNANLAGFPIKVIAAAVNKFVYSFVTPMSIAKPQDLKGKAVGVSSLGSGSDFITRMALKSWGLEPLKDVAILQIGNSPARLAALAAGKVQGSILSLPQTPQARKFGLRVLADLSQIDVEVPQSPTYASLALIKSRPDLMLNFLKAYLEAIRQFKTDKESAYKIIAKHTRIDRREEIQEYHEVLTKNFLLDFPMPTVAGVKTLLDDLGVKNPAARRLKPEDMIETRFLREIKDSGFMK